MYSTIGQYYNTRVVLLPYKELTKRGEKVFNHPVTLKGAFSNVTKVVHDDAGNEVISNSCVYLPYTEIQSYDELIIGGKQYRIIKIEHVQDFTRATACGLVVYL